MILEVFNSTEFDFHESLQNACNPDATFIASLCMYVFVGRTERARAGFCRKRHFRWVRENAVHPSSHPSRARSKPFLLAGTLEDGCAGLGKTFVQAGVSWNLGRVWNCGTARNSRKRKLVMKVTRATAFFAAPPRSDHRRICGITKPEQ